MTTPRVEQLRAEVAGFEATFGTPSAVMFGPHPPPLPAAVAEEVDEWYGVWAMLRVLTGLELPAPYPEQTDPGRADRGAGH